LPATKGTEPHPTATKGSEWGGDTPFDMPKGRATPTGYVPLGGDWLRDFRVGGR